MNLRVKIVLLFLLLGGMILPLAATFPGNCLHFEAGDYVTGSGIPTTMTGVTLECWVKHDVFPTSVQRYVTLKSEAAVIRAESGGVLKFYIKQSNGSLYSISATVLAEDEWLHVAGTYDGTTLKLYLNGIEVASGTASVGGFTAPTGEFDLGSSGESMRGYLDDIRVFNYALPQSLIQLDRWVEIQNQGGLVAYWKLNESSGTTAYSSVSSAHGTLMNMSSANWVASDNQAPTHNPGNAMVFNSPVSAGQHLELQARYKLPIYNNGTSNAYTVSMWVKGAAQNSHAVYAEGLTGTNQPCFKIMTTTSGKVMIYILHSGGLVLNRTSAATAFDDTWHHIAWVDNNGTATLYIDGVPDATDFNYTRVTVSLNNSTIGAAHGQYASNFYVGQIDELCLWKTALSATQVRQFRHGAGYNSYSNLVGMYQFNESTGNVAYDVQSGNNGLWTSSNMSDASRVASGAPIGPSYGGNVYTTTWSVNPTYVYDNITIPSTYTLTISPGVTVNFDGYYQVAVQGRVLANGTVSDSIRFTAEASNPWHGFRFIDTPTSNDSTKFAYCSFTNALGGTASPDYLGSAIYAKNFGKISAKYCSFRDNSNPCPLYSGAGGVIYLYYANILVQYCEFINNSCGNTGGAIGMYGSSPVIEFCTFTGNEAGLSGGAVYITHGSPAITNCVFTDNHSETEGGAILARTAGSSVAAIITNCLIEGNSSATDGGGIALMVSQNTTQVINCTIINNLADNGGGLLLSSTGYKTIKNTLIWGNSAASGDQVRITATTQANFYNCDIEDGSAGFSYGAGATLAGVYTNCFDQDPQLSYSASDPGTGWTIGAYSPCINAGDPATSLSGAALIDVNGNDRFYDNPYYTGNLQAALGRIDVGAIEEQTGNPVIPDGTVLEQDYTFDAAVYLYPTRTLTVNAGVTLSFGPDAWAYIMGNLLANGTVEDMVTFTESVPGARWKGFKFAADTSQPDPHSILDYCVVERGQNGAGTDWGGNIHVWYYDDLLLRNCMIRDGLAQIGGALYTRGSTVKMINCVMSDNVCSERGTGFYSNSSLVEIINCTIAGNYKTGSQATPSTLAALYFNNVAVQPKIRNCIIWGNGPSPLYLEGGTFTDLLYCDIEGGYAGTGNIDADPCFTGDASHPHNVERWSYCLNAGTPDVTGLNLPDDDLAGNPRIHAHSNAIYDRVDMGAYEYQGLLAAGALTASDGNNDYPGYVRLEWDFNPDYNIPINGFKIFRNGILYETLSNEILVYSDYNVTPGTIYSYMIQTYYNTEWNNSVADEGYIKPNGIISGNVKSANNNPVMGVQVSITPSTGYCLHLSSASSASVSIPDPGANLNSNFTLELWVNTTNQDVVLFNSGTHTLSINSSGLVQYTDGVHTLVQDDTSVDVNDADWHHIAVVSDFTNTQVLMYLDDIPSASATGYIFGNYISAGFAIPVGLTGYVDDLRVWEAARDSSDIVNAMNIVVSYDSPGLKGYWAMNEGTGSSVYDATNNSANGSMSNCTWSSADPDIALGAITNEWGDYIITQISYGAATTFAVTPAKPGHIFQPEQRLVTLSSSNIAADDVNFTDNSLIPISGYVKFQGTIVPVEGAIIYLNGSPALPRIISDDEGYYVLEVEHGTDCLVSVSYNDHPFNRTWNLGSVTYPRSNINFEDIFRTEFKLDVVGGQDSYPIGDFDVSLGSVDGLYTRDITGQDWSSGSVMVSNIPPLEYNVTVDPGDFDPFGLLIDDQFQSMKTKYLDMRDPDDTLDTLRYEWRAPLQIEVAWPDTVEVKSFAEYPGNDFYLLTQNTWYSVLVKACEDYSYDGHPDQKTYLNDCKLVVNDEVGDNGLTDNYFDGETEFEYEFVPYLPNIQGGYDRQYQNLIEFTVEDESLNRFSTRSDWVLTQGVKPLESTFATTSPELPFLILHDPPGDCSYSSFNQSSSHSVSMGIKVCTDRENASFVNLHLGPDISFEEGCSFFNIETVIDATADESWEWTTEMHQENSFEQTLTFTTSTEYQTAENDDIIGDFGADVYVGGAMNLVWGITNELYWDYEEDDIYINPNLMVAPDGFATRYIYTESQIVNTVIPNLYAIGDTTSAAMWQSYLDLNEYNKSHAETNPNHPGNVSFSAGPQYTYTEETSSSFSHSFEFETTLSSEFVGDWGLTVDGIGVDGGIRVKTSMGIGSSVQTGFETSTTSTFVLADDDVASDLTFNSDYFSVDIGTDPVYGTPTFNLVSGASSCHWEPNTQPRDGVMLTANSYTASDIPAGQPAIFLLYLSNTSQTNEPRRYFLTVMQATNTMGATVKVNGLAIEEKIGFDLEGGETVTAVLTVEPGPLGYELEGLTLEFYAEGDRGYDGPDGHYFDIFKSFNIYWEAPYSRVTIMYPDDGWLVNQALNDTLEVILRDYDLSKEDFRSVKLQYKHPSSTTWLPAFEIFRDELVNHPFYISVPWDVSSLSDGLYEIRAATTDSIHADYYTAAKAGTIDRSSPEVLGLPQPADGILQLGDEISLRFNEDIDPNSILPGCVSMAVVGGFLEIDTEVQCYDNLITIVPQVVNFWMENQTFEVCVQDLTDIHGNPMAEPIQWEFFVNSNPVNWQTTKIELIKPIGDPMSFSTSLINSGGQLSSFSLEELPPWLTASPMSGTLLPLDTETITFTISSQIGFGTYRDTLYADIPSLGREPLVVVVRVLADPPQWTTLVNFNYDHTMTLIGQMVIDWEVSEDQNDIIGAFIQNGSGEYECRGVTNTQYVDYLGGSYQFFLTVHSDVDYGEDVLLRVWDASSCKDYFGVEEEYVFASGANYGTPVTPEAIHPLGQMIKEKPLAAGWTWISTNLLDASMAVNDVLASLSPAANDVIKNQTQYAQYATGTGWVGSLSALATDEMYKIKLAAADNLVLTGELEDPDATEIGYGVGWNWISYIPHVSISVGEALGNITNLATGDLLKSQLAFAQYISGYGWVGSLRFMNPGEGYLLKTANSGSFTYPDYQVTRSWQRRPEPGREVTIPGWELDPLAYEYSANITAVVHQNGLPAPDNFVVGAFVGDECRGVAEAIEVMGGWMYFLTVYANAYNELLSFKVYDTLTQTVYDLPNTLPFVNNQVTGSPLEPYVLLLGLEQPEAPQNLQLQRSGSSLLLSWDPVPGALTYRVYTCQDPYADAPAWTLAATNLFIPHWTDHNPGIRKFYRVTAVFTDVRGNVQSPPDALPAEKPSPSRSNPEPRPPQPAGLSGRNP
jgi:hypothetical protein